MTSAFDGIDEGLAGERTDLAWSRSGLSLIACGAAIARGLPTLVGTPAQPVIGLVVLALGGAIWVVGSMIGRKRRGEPGAVATSFELSSIAFGTATVGLAGIALVLVQANV